MDTLVCLSIPAHQGVAVLLFGADVVREVGQGAGGAAGDGAHRRMHPKSSVVVLDRFLLGRDFATVA
ncbi:hypothetical protein [Streptomyces alanosinicus]|uniref:hypothetical protein n=1 Tax=Streptomyces alanosinicus TaxID=68171 RepID=UPI0016727F1C